MSSFPGTSCPTTNQNISITLKVLKVSRFSQSLLVLTGVVVNVDKSSGSLSIPLPLCSRAHIRFSASPSVHLSTMEEQISQRMVNLNPKLICSVRFNNSPLTTSGAVVLDGLASDLLFEATLPPAPKRKRHEVFAKWLNETLKLDDLLGLGDGVDKMRDKKNQQRYRVLDVAGGKFGRLSFSLNELSFCMSCTVVDPAANDPLSRPTSNPLININFSPMTISAYLKLPSQSSPQNNTINNIFVGLHPDQATDAIVDEALVQKAPFAVIPCCVFPQIFTSRRQADGKNVTSYGGLLRYLRQKHKHIRVAELGFVGRDTCVFMLPEDYIDNSVTGKSWNDDVWWDEFRVGAMDDVLHVEDDE